MMLQKIEIKPKRLGIKMQANSFYNSFTLLKNPLNWHKRIYTYLLPNYLTRNKFVSTSTNQPDITDHFGRKLDKMSYIYFFFVFIPIKPLSE